MSGYLEQIRTTLAISSQQGIVENLDFIAFYAINHIKRFLNVVMLLLIHLKLWAHYKSTITSIQVSREQV